MIIVKVMGGLGNQLFTYATAYALAKANRHDLLLDEIIYQTYYDLRECQLHDFNINESHTLTSFSLGHSKVGKKLFNMYHDTLLDWRYHPEMVEEEREFEFQDFKLEEGKNYYLDGYWQNHLYFDVFREDLRRQFVPIDRSEAAQRLVAQAKEQHPAVMHVRRSDYKTFRGGMCLSLSFYEKSLDLLRSTRGDDVPVWVFSDDIEYCKARFSHPNMRFISGSAMLSDVEEFWVMCHGSDFIIANSTFSWWAAYLGAAPGKLVIAPVVDVWSEAFYLPEWTTMNAAIA